MPGPQRILSGVQPSGKLHLGNYFGAIQQHIALQDQGEAFYFIADYHALTTLKDAEAKDLSQASLENDNALARIIGGLGPVVGAQAGVSPPGLTGGLSGGSVA